MKKVETDRVTVIGLGKLGLPFALAMARRGCIVRGVDTSATHRKNISRYMLGSDVPPPIQEPGVGEILRAGELITGFSMYGDCRRPIQESDLSFVIVPTPSQSDGSFYSGHVQQVCEQIGMALRNRSEYHLVVVMSTVMPGTTMQIFKPALERASGKTCGESFGLCYSPQFVALGSVIQNFMNPDFMLIGEGDQQAGDRLMRFYQTLLPDDPPICRMTPENAEVTKLALNNFVTMKINFANLLARVCERVPNGHVDVITSALGLDRRIGPRYLLGGTSYGGPCFPRDTRAFAAFLRSIGVSVDIPIVVEQMNKYHFIRLADVVAQLSAGKRVVVLGLSYKAGTTLEMEATGSILFETLDKLGRDVIGLACDVPFERVQAEVERADLIVITLPHDPFARLKFQAGQTVLDCWRMFEPTDLPEGVQLLQVGVNEYAPGRAVEATLPEPQLGGVLQKESRDDAKAEKESERAGTGGDGDSAADAPTSDRSSG